MKKRKGFTLVELMIVIVIIGILAAVIIPTVTNAIEKAKFSNDQSDAKNMNTVLAMYCAENNIDMKLLEAPEVRAIVSSGEKNYTFNPKSKTSTFWYNQAEGKIEIDKGEALVSSKLNSVNAATVGGSIEEIVPGKLYLNTTGELANVLFKLRNLSSVADYTNIKNSINSTKLNANLITKVTEIIKKFDPIDTLYINTMGFVSSYNSAGYSNAPVYVSNSWQINGVAIDLYTDKNGTTVTTVPTAQASVVSFGTYWRISDGTNTGFTKENDAATMPKKDEIKNIVFGSDILVIPEMPDSLINTRIDSQIKIKIPTTVKVVSDGAFSKIVSNNTIIAKSGVQFVEGALSESLKATNAITETKANYERIRAANRLIVVKIGDTAQFGFTKDSDNNLTKGTYTELELVYENGIPKMVKKYTSHTDSTASTAEEELRILGKINATSQPVDTNTKFVIDTSALLAKYKNITNLTVKQFVTCVEVGKDAQNNPIYSYNTDIYVQAFDKDGLLVNVVISIKRA